MRTKQKVTVGKPPLQLLSNWELALRQKQAADVFVSLQRVTLFEVTRCV